ncbi:MAG: hypothetical protein V4550_02060 [Gemmatimonadota bacterium]
MTEWSEDQLSEYLAQTLPPADHAEARALLETYGEQSYEREIRRVRRVLLQSCGGSLDRLRRLIAIAKVDYRDVLVRDPGPGL